jgi:hypothetical protein
MNDSNPNPVADNADHADTLTDLNLRAFADVMKMPGEAPIADDTRVHDAHEARPARRRSRRPRWFAFGSAAAAACLAIAGIVYTQHSTPRVQAAEILASLRQAQILGLDIALDHLSTEGVTVDGLLRMRLKHPVAVEQIDDPAAWDQNNFGAVHAALHITTDGRAQEAPNLDATFEMAFTEQFGWIYIKTDAATADHFAQQFPPARGFIGPAANGLLLNIGPIDEEFLSGLNVNVAHDDRIDGPSGRPSITVSGSAHQADPDAHTPGTVSVETSIKVSGAGNDALEQLSTNLLRGTAGRAEIDQIKSLLNGQNQQATVNDLGQGRYELVTMLKDTDEAQPSARMTILYEQNAGVRTVSIEPLDGATGAIHLAMAEAPINPADLDIARAQAIPGTTYFDMRMFRSLIQSFAQPSMSGAPSSNQQSDEPMNSDDPDTDNNE